MSLESNHLSHFSLELNGGLVDGLHNLSHVRQGLGDVVGTQSSVQDVGLGHFSVLLINVSQLGSDHRVATDGDWP